METPVTHAENSPLPEDLANGPAWTLDERWLLAQRIVASHGFQRAAQLRRILEHITRVTITQPGVVLREYEIACDVLGRRANFDPANDNIVRQQMSQLRRRVEQYYQEEGQHETLRLTIPKGSYAPHFEPIALQPEEHATVEEDETSPVQIPGGVAPARGVTLSWPVLAGVLTAVAVLLACVWFLRGGGSTPQRAAVLGPATGSANAFVEFLSRANGRVTIVQPDLSLVMIQNELDLDVSPSEYGQPEFLKQRILSTADSRVRDLLLHIESRRMTSSEEAGICSDLLDELVARGKIGSVRFARDIRTRDLGDGNLILIGSRRSDPWVMLFTPPNDFQFEAAGNTLYQFVNQHPGPGEKKLYVPYERQDGKISSYVDVAFGPNLTNSGYVLIVNGSDVVANVAAARFLFRGKLNSEIANLLQKPNLSRFELFLRGSHAEDEAEDTFDLIAVRSSTN